MTDLTKPAAEIAGGLKDNPRANRLLSPIFSHLDVRAFAAKRGSAGTLSMVRNFIGVIIGLVVIAAILSAVVWYFQSTNNQPKTQILQQTYIPSLRIVRPILEITDVELRRVTVNGQSIALVLGHIVNRAGDKMLIPHLDIVLRGKDGQNITSWRYRPLQTSLKAGASIHFSSKFTTNVYPDSVVDVKFVSGDSR